MMINLALMSLSLAACLDADPVPPGITAPIEATNLLGLHEACEDHAACEPPALCLAYYGVAGSSGPQIMTCEIRCDAETSCPAGTTCDSLVDGPGMVCR